jgi:hypothetical protein
VGPPEDMTQPLRPVCTGLAVTVPSPPTLPPGPPGQVARASTVQTGSHAGRAAGSLSPAPRRTQGALRQMILPPRAPRRCFEFLDVPRAAGEAETEAYSRLVQSFTGTPAAILRWPISPPNGAAPRHTRHLRDAPTRPRAPHEDVTPRSTGPRGPAGFPTTPRTKGPCPSPSPLPRLFPRSPEPVPSSRRVAEERITSGAAATRPAPHEARQAESTGTPFAPGALRPKAGPASARVLWPAYQNNLTGRSAEVVLRAWSAPPQVAPTSFGRLYLRPTSGSGRPYRKVRPKPDHQERRGLWGSPPRRRGSFRLPFMKRA